MATITQLKTRLALMLNRDDTGTSAGLEQALIDSYTAAIDEHANELFWFNRASGTATTTANTATVAQPSGMRIPLVVSYLQKPLRKVRLEQIQHLTDKGTPTEWAENEGAIQLHPVPDAAYALSVQGVAELGVPVTSNEWTVEAYELICASTAKRMCMAYLRDAEGAALYKVMETDALSQLRGETRKRLQVALTSDAPPTRSSFNINLG